jgi:vacuolar protein-sorting-associated protein 4
MCHLLATYTLAHLNIQVNHSGAEKLTPSDPHEPGAVAMSWRQVPAHKLLEPPLRASDFFNVLHKVKPSVSEEDIRRNKEWTEEYGSEGA